MFRVAPLDKKLREQTRPTVQSIRCSSNGNLLGRISDTAEEFPPLYSLKRTKTEGQKRAPGAEGMNERHLASCFETQAALATEGSKEKELPDVLREIEASKPPNFVFEAKVTCLASCRQGAVVGLKDGSVSLIGLFPVPDKAMFHGLMHTEEVTCLAVSHDGKSVVSGSRDKTIRVWDLFSLSYDSSLVGHAQSVTCLAVTPEGKFLISGSADNTVRMWHLEEGLEWMIFRGHAHIVRTIVLSPDGKSCASASVDGVVKVWGLEERKQLASLEGHTDFVTCLSFSFDGFQILSGSQDMTVKVWNVDLRRELTTLVGHSRYIECLCLTPDGLHLVTGSGDNSLKLWSMSDFREEATFLGHTQEVNSVCVTPDSCFIISGSQDNTVKVWSVEELCEVATFEGHKERVRSIVVTHDGAYVISASGKEVKAWALEDQSNMFTFSGHTCDVTSIAVSSDGQYILSGSSNGEVKLWDAEMGMELATLRGHASWVTNIFITSNCKFAVSTSADQSVKLWHIPLRKEVASFEGHSSFVECLCISPDNRFIITGSGDNLVKIWSLELKEEIASLEGHTKWVTNVCMTPDGKLILSASVDRTIRVWSMSEKLEVATLTGHTDMIECLAVTRDGMRAVSGSGDSTIRLWSLASRSEEETLTGHRGRVKCICITPDGKRLVSGSADMCVKVWCLEERRELMTLLGHSLIVKLLAVTPDSKFALSGSEDNTLKLWSLEEGRELATLRNHTRKLHCFALTVAGSRVISGSADNTLTSVDITRFISPAWNYPEFQSVTASAVLTSGNLQKMRTGVAVTKKVYQSRVMPYLFNGLHISAYFNHSIVLGSYLRAGAQILRGAYGSPLTVALRRNTCKCIDTILEYFAIVSQDDSASVAFSAITEDLPQLLVRSSSFLVPFVSRLFTLPSQTNLPQFIAPLHSLPCTRFFPTRLIRLQDFARTGGIETETRLVEFCVSMFRWNFSPGSAESLLLLRALRACKHKKVLTTDFVATLIKTKWEFFFPLTLTLTVIYLLLLINLVVLMFPYWRSDVLGAFFIFFNSFSLLYEVIQMVGFGRFYLLDVWNVIDLTRGTLSIMWTLLLLDGTNPQYLQLVVVMLCFLRGFTYFRSFKMTRIFVYMTIQVVREIYSFLAILAYSVFAFGILASIMSGDNGVLTSWTTAFNLLMGNFDDSDFGFIQWLVFIAAAVVNVVIMLNLLISILGEAYNKTQTSILENDIQQMLGLITEYESIIFWRRNSGEKSIMVKCRVVAESMDEDEEEQEWIGSISRITKSIKDEHKTLQKKLKAMEAQFSTIEANIRADIRAIAPGSQQPSRSPLLGVQRPQRLPSSSRGNSAGNSESEDEEENSDNSSARKGKHTGMRDIAIDNTARRASANPLALADFVRRVSANALLSLDSVQKESSRTLRSSMSRRLSSVSPHEGNSGDHSRHQSTKSKFRALEGKLETLQEDACDKFASVESKIVSMEAKLDLILQSLNTSC